MSSSRAGSTTRVEPSVSATDTTEVADNAPRDMPVRPRPVPRQVHEILLRRIVAGEYAPGERMVETRIARELQVSQGSVREALRHLETSGLVQYVAHRGVVVRTVSAAEYADVAVVRAVLEAAAAELAARRGMPTDMLREQLVVMAARARDGDLRSWVTAAVQFHRLIVEGSGNAVLTATWEGLNIEARTIQVARDPKVSLIDQDPAHRAIVDAIEQQDASLAASLSARHEESFTPFPEGGTR